MIEKYGGVFGAVFKVYSFCTNGDRMEISALVKKLCLEEKGCHKSQSHFEGKDSFSLNIADWKYIWKSPMFKIHFEISRWIFPAFWYYFTGSE